MLGGSNAISGNAINAGESAPVTYTLVGRQITAARGAIAPTYPFFLTGQQINAYQDYFADFQDLERLVGQGLVVRQGTPSRYQGFNMPNLLSLQARQGSIQIQKLIYFLDVGTAYFTEFTNSAELYHSLFGEDSDQRIIVVPEEEERGIEILEEYRGMLVAPARIGNP